MMFSQPKSSSERKAALPADLKLELKRDARAPSVARAAVIGHCHHFDLSPSLCHTLVLIVSEVVSNAVLHSRGPADAPIVLTASVAENAIRLTVTDAGDGFTPEPRKSETKHGGYGLYLLEKSASRWGVDRVGGTRVWFELSRSA